MKKFLQSIKKHSTFFTALMLAIATFFAFLLFYLVPQNLANVVLIYILALILISRYTPGYYYGSFACIFCVVFVNYCFTYPYFKIDFTLAGYPITFLGMLAISLITSTTTSHMIQQSQILAKREKQLMEADKEKMRANLLRAVSHDLRTPLTSIMGSISSYFDTNTTLSKEERDELIRHIYDDSSWLLNMVENLLSVTRIHNDATSVKKSLEAVEEVVEEAVSRLKKRIPDANILVSVPQEFLMIPMDAILIEQVLINLLENALVHANSKLPIELKITANKTAVIFYVIDYGVGIQKNKINEIFDGIPQNEAHTADSHKGMGIGLSICKTIILAHKGNIWADNHNTGAEFVFELPRQTCDEEETGRETE